MRNVRELFDSLLFLSHKLNLERRPRFSWFLVHHIEFHMLGRSAIESGVLEHIKIGAFFVHFFPFIYMNYAEVVTAPIFS